MSAMKLGDRGLALIKHYEGCSLVAYKDSVGVLTIGWGHTDGVSEGDICTQPEADELLVQDLAWAEDAVEALVTVPLSQSMYDALVSWAFNLGVGNLEDSTMLKKLNVGDYVHAAHEMTRWFETPGSELGLLRRRLAEASLFLEDSMPSSVGGEVA